MARLEAAAFTERDKLLIRVLADTGIRLGEALDLRDNDITEPVRGQSARHVKGKSGERIVPLQTQSHGACARTSHTDDRRTAPARASS